MKIFLFDVDGTLTPARKSMESSHAWDFLDWISGVEEKRVYIVSGSDRRKILEQLPSSILSRCSGAFCCMANQFWDNEKGLVYSNEWNPPKSLISQLNDYVLNSEYEKVGSGNIESRPGMINFSTVGRAATAEERLEYNLWDRQSLESESICVELKTRYPDLDISIGGQISIDINPKGNNKSQCTKWIRQNAKEPDSEFVFFGDKCHKGGNDYDIVEDINKNRDGVFFSVDGPEETLSILTSEY